MTATTTSALAPPHVTVGGAAHLLGCTRHRVLSLIAQGLLTPTVIAGRVFVPRHQIIALPRSTDETRADAASRTRRARSRA